MNCEICNYIPMTRSIISQVVLPGWAGIGYSKIVEYECPECENKVRKVA